MAVPSLTEVIYSFADIGRNANLRAISPSLDPVGKHIFLGTRQLFEEEQFEQNSLTRVKRLVAEIVRFRKLVNRDSRNSKTTFYLVQQIEGHCLYASAVLKR